MMMKMDGARPHPHFADGVSQAFVAACLVQCHSVKLSFIQVTHRPLALFLSQWPRGIQRVLERVSVQKKPKEPRSGKTLSYEIATKYEKCQRDK